MEQATGVSIIVPAYNEEEAIAATLDELVAIMEASPYCERYEVLVIDDGSTDRTGTIVRERLPGLPNVRLLAHSVNRGYGAALKMGIRHARYANLVITDADRSYPNERIPELVQLLEENGYAMVVGARVGQGVAIPLARRPARWALGKLANFLARTPIPDINSGLRAMSRPVVERFFGLLPDGFSFTMTITLAMLADEYAVHFVPIAYRPRVGRSKIRPVHDTLNFLQIIIRTTLLFAPLRVFTPISLSLAILTGLKVIADIVRYDWHIATSTVVAAVVTLQMFLLGYLADLIVSTRAK
jgi:glycosyltransferase involved in cell wall biosynthesis